MIYWFIGQPGCGKTTLARRLKEYLHHDSYGKSPLHLDGDDLRKIFGAYDKEHFTKEYRIEWTKTLQRFVAHVADQGITIIMSTVNSYRDVREEFKTIRKDLKEIYVHTDDIRGRENWHVENFEPPEANYIDVKTGGGQSEEESFQVLLSRL